MVAGPPTSPTLRVWLALPGPVDVGVGTAILVGLDNQTAFPTELSEKHPRDHPQSAREEGKEEMQNVVDAGTANNDGLPVGARFDPRALGNLDLDGSIYR
jgi:hypothetical protein